MRVVMALLAAAQDVGVLTLPPEAQQRLVEEVGLVPDATPGAVRRLVAAKFAVCQQAATQQAMFQQLLAGLAAAPGAAAVAAGGPVFGAVPGGGAGMLGAPAAAFVAGVGQLAGARPRATPSNSACRRCGQMGHWQRMCPLTQQRDPAAGANRAPMGAGPLLLGPPGQP